MLIKVKVSNFLNIQSFFLLNSHSIYENLIVSFYFYFQTLTGKEVRRFKYQYFGSKFGLFFKNFLNKDMTQKKSFTLYSLLSLQDVLFLLKYCYCQVKNLNRWSPQHKFQVSRWRLIN